MRSSKLWIALLLALQVAQAGAREPYPQAFLQIPDGLPQGRPEAAYGVYGSVFHASLQPFQKALDELENKIYGFEKMTADDVTQAEAAYYLENLAVGLHHAIAELTGRNLFVFEKNALLFRAAELYDDIRGQAERLFEVMIRKVDVALPGATGVQSSRGARTEDDRDYVSSYRSEKPLTKKQREIFYQKRLQEFLREGGKMSDLKVFSKAVFKKMGAYSRVEYAERTNGELWITDGSAGHLVLAGGGRVNSAGQIVFVKNRRGQATLVVVSNASGNFKPDLYAAQGLAQKLARELNLPQERVLVTKGEPLSTQTFRILLKAQLVPKEEIKSRAKRIEAWGERMREKPEEFFKSPPHKSCSDLLTG